MKIKIALAFIMAVQLFCFAPASVADIYNPKPADGDFILPMPDGAKIVFRPVFIGEGAKPFAFREFKIGDPGGGYKEYPTDVVIGGSFIKTGASGQKDWMYYIGKYEVTQAQYNAVMRPGTNKESQTPMTNLSWYDVQEFIKKYNVWLYANAKGKMPKHDNEYGFVTLPTEIEWEFAARGGSLVEQTVFDKKYPYKAPLSKYEWFAGPSSSHGKIKKIGKLLPNPLKIHDMLGNVNEMTASLYQIEYYQGRTGGFAARGGTSFHKQSKIRSSLRVEIPFFKSISGKVIPTKQPALGFRLAISSPIYAGRKSINALSAAWEDYRQTRPVPASPAVAALPASSRTSIQLADALRSLEILWNEIKDNHNVSRAAKSRVEILKTSFKDIESTVNRAERKFAFSWVKVISEKLFTMYYRDQKELPGKYGGMKIAKKIGNTVLAEQLKKQIEAKEKNIKEAWESYGETMKALEKIKEKYVNDAFDEYIDDLIRKIAPLQVKFTEKIVRKHYKEYMRTKRLNTSQWKRDLAQFEK